MDRVDRDGTSSSRASAAGPQPHAGVCELFVHGPWLLIGRPRNGNQTFSIVQEFYEH